MKNSTSRVDKYSTVIIGIISIISCIFFLLNDVKEYKTCLSVLIFNLVITIIHMVIYKVKEPQKSKIFRNKITRFCSFVVFLVIGGKFYDAVKIVDGKFIYELLVIGIMLPIMWLCFYLFYVDDIYQK